jgi:hypothetical protein
MDSLVTGHLQFTLPDYVIYGCPLSRYVENENKT